LRPERLGTQKVVTGASRIAGGSGERLRLGNMKILRDWGWAPEYVEAMYLMLQQSQAGDYVIATGESCLLEDFVAAAFVAVGLDWREHVEMDDSLLRPTDLAVGRGNPGKAKCVLGWVAKYKMKDVVMMMSAAQVDRC
jgi:GDPmannose 4,6-dehydratase